MNLFKYIFIDLIIRVFASSTCRA